GAYYKFAATCREDRALDHGGLTEHQGDGLLLGHAFLVLVGELLEGRAGAVEQRLPADLPGPALQMLAVDPGVLVVVKGVCGAALVEPGARLLHGVAVLDA